MAEAGSPLGALAWALLWARRVVLAGVAGDGGVSRMAQEGKTMIGTEIWRASPIRRADGMASAVSSTDSGSRRVGVRLWALLHAPALLGSIGGPGDVAFMEDDRRRLAARRAR